MRNATGPRILAMALMAVAALALAGCGNGPKRRITTTVTTTTPARVAAPIVGAATVAPVAGAAGVAGASAAGIDGAGTAGARAGGDAAKRGGGAAVPAAQPVNPDLRKTSDKMLAATVGFGVLADGVAQTVAAGGAGLAGAGGQQCQNPFGTQPAGNGQLICSAGEERLMCQCDDNGCQLVPTGIMSCLPVGAVYQ
jgi:hypothetical protein